MYHTLKIFLRWLSKILFKTKVNDLAGLDKLGDKVVYISNHISYLDSLMLIAYLPGKPLFVLDAQTLSKGWVKFFMRFVDLFVLDPTNPIGIKTLTEEVKKGRSVVMFSEGRITETGTLMKAYEAPGLIADKAGAMIVPIQINGLQYSYFSKLAGSVDRRPFPRVTITILEPRKFPRSRKAREQREYVSDQLYRIMMEASYSTMFDKNASIFSFAMKAAKLYGHSGWFSRRMVVEDASRKPQSHKDVLIKSFVLGRKLAEYTKADENVGLMMPNTIANLCAFFGLTAYDRVPAMINFTSGEKNVLSAIKTAAIKRVVTSRQFVAAASLESLVEAIKSNKTEIIFLEDLVPKISLLDKIKAYLLYKIKHVPNRIGGNKKALILFTSGSEGAPKAVALSHANIIANIAQITAMIPLSPRDKFFNALPMFHSFGITVCTLLPFMVGCQVFLYPTPLHYRIIPELCYNINATLLCGTNTFLRNYAKQAHPYDFYSLRLVACGAEKLTEDTRTLWMDKFGLRIIIGYGATETSPVLTFNSPMYTRIGSIGKIVPGIEYKIKKIDGVENGGELVVRGDSVMLGYMKEDKPGKIVPPKDGWYETGDIVEVDDDGYIFIKDRLKRFAKVAGEMVPLSNVENMAREAYIGIDEEAEFAAVSIPHEMKGEQIVLISTSEETKLSEVASFAKKQKIPELWVPKTLLFMEELPLLNSGKRDYPTLKAEVMEKLNIA